ncbi:hypothetical protein ACT4EA_004175 [Escherichia coli]
MLSEVSNTIVSDFWLTWGPRILIIFFAYLLVTAIFTFEESTELKDLRDNKKDYLDDDVKKMIAQQRDYFTIRVRLARIKSAVAAIISLMGMAGLFYFLKDSTVTLYAYMFAAYAVIVLTIRAGVITAGLLASIKDHKKSIDDLSAQRTMINIDKKMLSQSLPVFVGGAILSVFFLWHALPVF